MSVPAGSAHPLGRVQTLLREHVGRPKRSGDLVWAQAVRLFLVDLYAAPAVVRHVHPPIAVHAPIAFARSSRGKIAVRIESVARSSVSSAVIEAKVSMKRSRVEPRVRAPAAPWARKAVTACSTRSAAPIAANM